TPASISSSEDLIDSSEGGSLDCACACAGRSRTVAETRNAPAMAKQTACRPRASQVRLTVIRPSPSLRGNATENGVRFARLARCARAVGEASPQRLDSLKTRV